MLTEITQSMLGAWARCPESFRRRYIEGEIIPPGIAARIGTGLHKGAEVNHRAKLTTGRDEPLSVVTDAARDGYVTAVKEGVYCAPEERGGIRKALAEGVGVTVALAGLYHSELAPAIIPHLVEERLRLEHPALPVPFSGQLDVLTIDGWLPDLKSADKKWPQSRADASLQATLYWRLAREAVGKAPRRLSFEVFTKAAPVHQSLETTRCEADFEALVRRAVNMWRSILAGAFPFASPEAWQCNPKYCGFWWTCPYIPIHRRNTK